MSWKATAYVKPLRLAPDGSPLSRSEKFLLFILADYHNEEQRAAWPSGSTLARDALMTLRHVRNLLAALKAKGLLCTGRRVSAEGDFDTTVYHFHAIDCDGPHAPEREDEGAPAEGGSEMVSLPPAEGGSEIAISPGSEAPYTTVVNGASLPVVKNPRAHNKDEPPFLTSSEPTTEPTHTHAGGAGPEPGEGPLLRLSERVCVQRTKFSFEERLAFARNQAQLRNPSGWVMSGRVCAGEFDEAIERWRAGQGGAPGAAKAGEQDVSACPDCHGSGWWYPQGVERGAARCKHLKLAAGPALSDAGGVAEARAGPSG